MEKPKEEGKRKPYTEEVRVVNFLSKYRYKKSLVNKPVKSLIFYGKLTQVELENLLSTKNQLLDNQVINSKLNRSIDKYTIVYVHREYKDPLHR